MHGLGFTPALTAERPVPSQPQPTPPHRPPVPPSPSRKEASHQANLSTLIESTESESEALTLRSSPPGKPVAGGVVQRRLIVLVQRLHPGSPAPYRPMSRCITS